MEQDHGQWAGQQPRDSITERGGGTNDKKLNFTYGGSTASLYKQLQMAVSSVIQPSGNSANSTLKNGAKDFEMSISPRMPPNNLSLNQTRANLRDNLPSYIQRNGGGHSHERSDSLINRQGWGSSIKRDMVANQRGLGAEYLNLNSNLKKRAPNYDETKNSNSQLATSQSKEDFDKYQDEDRKSSQRGLNQFLYGPPREQTSKSLIQPNEISFAPDRSNQNNRSSFLGDHSYEDQENYKQNQDLNVVQEQVFSSHGLSSATSVENDRKQSRCETGLSFMPDSLYGENAMILKNPDKTNKTRKQQDPHTITLGMSQGQEDIPIDYMPQNQQVQAFETDYISKQRPFEPDQQTPNHEEQEEEEVPVRDSNNRQSNRSDLRYQSVSGVAVESKSEMNDQNLKLDPSVERLLKRYRSRKSSANLDFQNEKSQNEIEQKHGRQVQSTNILRVNPSNIQKEEEEERHENQDFEKKTQDDSQNVDDDYQIAQFGGEQHKRAKAVYRNPLSTKGYVSVRNVNGLNNEHSTGSQGKRRKNNSAFGNRSSSQKSIRSGENRFGRMSKNNSISPLRTKSSSKMPTIIHHNRDESSISNPEQSHRTRVTQKSVIKSSDLDRFAHNAEISEEQYHDAQINRRSGKSQDFQNRDLLQVSSFKESKMQKNSGKAKKLKPKVAKSRSTGRNISHVHEVSDPQLIVSSSQDLQKYLLKNGSMRQSFDRAPQPVQQSVTNSNEKVSIDLKNFNVQDIGKLFAELKEVLTPEERRRVQRQLLSPAQNNDQKDLENMSQKTQVVFRQSTERRQPNHKSNVLSAPSFANNNIYEQVDDYQNDEKQQIFQEQQSRRVARTDRQTQLVQNGQMFQNDPTRSERQTKQRDCALTARQAETLMQQHTDLEQAHYSLRRKYADQTQHLEVTVYKLSQIALLKDNLTEQLANVETQLRQITEMAQYHEQREKKAKGEVTKLKEAILKAGMITEQTAQSAQAKETCIEDLIERNQGLERRIKEAYEREEEAKEDLKRCQMEMCRMRQDKMILEQHEMEQHTFHDDLLQKISSLEKRNQIQQSKFTDLSSELRQKDDRIDHLQQKVRSLEAQNQQFMRQIDKLKQLQKGEDTLNMIQECKSKSRQRQEKQFASLLNDSSRDDSQSFTKSNNTNPIDRTKLTQVDWELTQKKKLLDASRKAADELKRKERLLVEKEEARQSSLERRSLHAKMNGMRSVRAEFDLIQAEIRPNSREVKPGFDIDYAQKVLRENSLSANRSRRVTSALEEPQIQLSTIKGHSEVLHGRSSAQIVRDMTRNELINVSKSVSTERINHHSVNMQGNPGGQIKIHPNLVEDYSGRGMNGQAKNTIMTRNNSGSLVWQPNSMVHARNTSHHTFMRATPNHFQTEPYLNQQAEVPDRLKPTENERPKSLKQLQDLEEQNRKRLEKYDSQRDSQRTLNESNFQNNQHSLYQNQKLFSSQDELDKVENSQITKQKDDDNNSKDTGHNRVSNLMSEINDIQDAIKRDSSNTRAQIEALRKPLITGTSASMQVNVDSNPISQQSMEPSQLTSIDPKKVVPYKEFTSLLQPKATRFFSSQGGAYKSHNESHQDFKENPNEQNNFQDQKQNNSTIYQGYANGFNSSILADSTLSLNNPGFYNATHQQSKETEIKAYSGAIGERNSSIEDFQAGIDETNNNQDESKHQTSWQELQTVDLEHTLQIQN